MEPIIINKSLAKSLMPNRKLDGNKSTFGNLFLAVGSDKYPGAMLLCLEAALRSGAGYTHLMASEAVISYAIQKFPETIFHKTKEISEFSDADADSFIKTVAAASAIVIGCGSSKSKSLCRLCEKLLVTEGCPVIIDADAINSIAEYSPSPKSLFASAKRGIVITPHAMEFSRISGIPVDYINENREECAISFAKETGVTVVLKGLGTVITDGNTLYVNSSGSSALAKGGSGDTLAGLIGGLIASARDVPVLSLAALAVYVHGSAGDMLASELSAFGVTPSDLPVAMAKKLKELEIKNWGCHIQ